MSILLITLIVAALLVPAAFLISGAVDWIVDHAGVETYTISTRDLPNTAAPLTDADIGLSDTGTADTGQARR